MPIPRTLPDAAAPLLCLSLMLVPAAAAPKTAPPSIKTAVLAALKGLDVTADDELDAAADAAAGEVLDGEGEAGKAVQEAVLSEIQEHGVTDARVMPLVITAGSVEDLVASLGQMLEEKWAPLLDGRTIGVGARAGDGRAACVIVAVDRVLRLKGVVPAIAKPAKLLLKGAIVREAGALQVIVQSPDLEFFKPTLKIKGKEFSVLLPLDGGEGCYRIEILGDLGFGPAVLNLFTTCVGEAAGGAGAAWPSAAALEAGKAKNRAWALFHLINGLRSSKGLGALRVEGLLTAAALEHGRDMKANGFFGHTSPTAGTFEARMKKAGIAAASVAEVLAVADGPEKAFENLAASPSHLSQLLGGGYTAMGVAAVKASEGWLFVAVMASL
jgi:hypothetical protein